MLKTTLRVGSVIVLITLLFSTAGIATAATSSNSVWGSTATLVEPGAPPDVVSTVEDSSRSDRPEAASIQSAPSPFVQRSGTQFTLDGQVFRFGGANAYYISFDSQATVDDALQRAAAMNLKVIRVFGYHDHGSLDGSVPTVDVGGWNDIYFQYWDPATGKPAYNDGPGGLQRLDYAIDKAGKLGIKLIVTLTDNWNYHGGIDQYVTWYGLPYHDDFYSDARCKQAYKDYVNHVLNRVNSISGVRYKDDPAIMAWELANEPRLTGRSDIPSSGKGTAATITSWVQEMSAYVKSVDPNHLVSVGDEGFFNRPGADDWTYNGSQGVDSEALTNVPTVDFGVFHLYPELWEKSNDWGNQWISDHAQLSQSSGKPVLLEEFGLQDKSARNTVYKSWMDQLYQDSLSGFMFWTLGAIYPNGTPWPDDGFMIYYPCQTASIISAAALQFEQTASSSNPAPAPKPSAVVSEVYEDSLVGWSFQSSSGKTNLASTARHYSGSTSISYRDVAGASGLSIAPSSGSFDTRPYAYLRFYVRGDTTGGQNMGLAVQSGGAWGPIVNVDDYVTGGRVAARWRLVEIPLSALGADSADITGLNLRFLSGKGLQRVFIDEISFGNL
ncbi:MAG: cellulase family glycosylhydrolase [Chloroflexi bacterium]|nr:cellulase family glycosylhydrolase [Chloroflexota bacterium]